MSTGLTQRAMVLCLLLRDDLGTVWPAMTASDPLCVNGKAASITVAGRDAVRSISQIWDRGAVGAAPCCAEHRRGVRRGQRAVKRCARPRPGRRGRTHSFVPRPSSSLRELVPLSPRATAAQGVGPSQGRDSTRRSRPSCAGRPRSLRRLPHVAECFGLGRSYAVGRRRSLRRPQVGIGVSKPTMVWLERHRPRRGAGSHDQYGG